MKRRKSEEIINEVAEKEIRRAQEKNLENPEFDFREFYKKGDKIYYVYLNHMTGTKELLELIVRTVYARCMVGFEEKGICYMIGYPSRDWIFWDRREAESYYRSAKVEKQYG